MRRHIDDRPMLDLSIHHFQRQDGDLLLFGSWWGAEAQTAEPCLAIIPAYAQLGAFKPAVVCLSAAWAWRDEPRRSARMAAEFALGLGMKADMTTIRRITTLIVDHLEDLIRIPPRPHRHQVKGGHAFIRNSETGEITFAEAVHEV